LVNSLTTTSKAEKQRQYRERKLLRSLLKGSKDPSITVTLDPLLSIYYQKGLWLARAFIKAWAEVFTSPEWRSKYKRSHFQHFDSIGKDRPEPDFVIVAERNDGRIFRLAVVEIKNWFVPQWLNAERTEQKITKKFEKVYGSEWIKLLILTPAVRFQDSARDLLVQGNFKIERVDELPGSHPDDAGAYPRDTVEETLYKALEARSIEQMKRVLEKYFLE
jgi:hypothetical protein